MHFECSFKKIKFIQVTPNRVQLSQKSSYFRFLKALRKSILVSNGRKLSQFYDWNKGNRYPNLANLKKKKNQSNPTFGYSP